MSPQRPVYLPLQVQTRLAYDAHFSRTYLTFILLVWAQAGRCSPTINSGAVENSSITARQNVWNATGLFEKSDADGYVNAYYSIIRASFRMEPASATLTPTHFYSLNHHLLLFFLFDKLPPQLGNLARHLSISSRLESIARDFRCIKRGSLSFNIHFSSSF